MASLKPPSIAHTAALCFNDPQRTCRQLLRLAHGSGGFSYSRIFDAARDIMLWKQPLSDVEEGIRRAERREPVRNNFLTLLPLINRHYRDIDADYVIDVNRLFYPLTKDLMIPVDFPFLYGKNEVHYLPWMLFWRRNRLWGEKMSLFKSIVQDVQSEHPDLEDAQFQLIDFGCQSKTGGRGIRVLGLEEIPDITEMQKKELLTNFVEGYDMAKSEYDNWATKGQDRSRGKDSGDNDQPGLFD